MKLGRRHCDLFSITSVQRRVPAGGSFKRIDKRHSFILLKLEHDMFSTYQDITFLFELQILVMDIIVPYAFIKKFPLPKKIKKN